MSSSFKYRPRGLDIRIRPPTGDEEAKAQAEDVLRLKPGEKPCEWPDCRAAATAKAPKSRDMLNEHYLFCQSHAAEYNRNWNFFAGMSDAEVQKAQEARLTGERPTWQFKATETLSACLAREKRSPPPPPGTRQLAGSADLSAKHWRSLTWKTMRKAQPSGCAIWNWSKGATPTPTVGTARQRPSFSVCSRPIRL